jgi:hypothetical protein
LERVCAVVAAGSRADAPRGFTSITPFRDDHRVFAGSLRSDHFDVGSERIAPTDMPRVAAAVAV